jgi:hypothetical protein
LNVKNGGKVKKLLTVQRLIPFDPPFFPLFPLPVFGSYYHPARLSFPFFFLPTCFFLLAPFVTNVLFSCSSPFCSSFSAPMSTATGRPREQSILCDPSLISATRLTYTAFAFIFAQYKFDQTPATDRQLLFTEKKTVVSLVEVARNTQAQKK